MLFTPIFFTFSKSLIHPYTLPITVPASLLVTHYWSEIKFKKYYLSIPILSYLVILPIFYSGFVDKTIESNCDKGLVKNKLVSDYSLYYLNFKSFSSQFYSLGSIEKINVDQLRNKLINKEKLRIIVEKSEINKLDSFIIERLIEIDDTGKKQMYVSDF